MISALWAMWLSIKATQLKGNHIHYINEWPCADKTLFIKTLRGLDLVWGLEFPNSCPRKSYRGEGKRYNWKHKPSASVLNVFGWVRWSPGGSGTAWGMHAGLGSCVLLDTSVSPSGRYHVAHQAGTRPMTKAPSTIVQKVWAGPAYGMAIRNWLPKFNPHHCTHQIPQISTLKSLRSRKIARSGGHREAFAKNPRVGMKLYKMHQIAGDIRGV